MSDALAEWVQTVAYCENDRYAQAVLLSKMHNNQLERAPIWDDIRTLHGSMLEKIDIIFGGFPCQDISVAGNGKGLEGKRSGLFFEVLRLAKEIKPTFIFLENVPAIRIRGAARVGKELAACGYDCRWHTLSAQEVGANHKRERWFLLAANTSDSGFGSIFQQIEKFGSQKKANTWSNGKIQPMANRLNDTKWWSVEPNVGRVADGVAARVDRLKAIGNGQVPLCAATAWRWLNQDWS